MKSSFESSCVSVLVACLIAGVGLSLLSVQCSLLGIGITVAGLSAMAVGLVRVIASLPARLVAKFGKGIGSSPVPC